jgi:hypothetical protein
MCIATALLFSVAFQILHSLYMPFKSPSCNRLQQICFSVLNIIYFSGLLLKTESIEPSDEKDLGILLVALLILAMALVVIGVVLEVAHLGHALSSTRRLAHILRALPQKDPPDDSAEFYLIQSPVQESYFEDVFVPQPPSALAHLTDKAKLAVIHTLTAESEKRVESFLWKLVVNHSIPLQPVNASLLVDHTGVVCAKASRKSDESILAKASRPSILANNPNYSIEHVRDTFRFKAVVHSFRDAVEFILAMHADRNPDFGLFPDPKGYNGGLSARTVAKLDIAKLVVPKEWGWRFIAFDFIMPNHQLIECYIVFGEMDVAKKSDDSTATVCPELSNHGIFEKWRVVDTTKLTDERLLEYQRDKTESNRRYAAAFQAVLFHSSPIEMLEFWALFGEKNHNHSNFFTTKLGGLKKLATRGADFWGGSRGLGSGPTGEEAKRQEAGGMFSHANSMQPSARKSPKGRGGRGAQLPQQVMLNNPMHVSRAASTAWASAIDEEVEEEEVEEEEGLDTFDELDNHAYGGPGANLARVQTGLQTVQSVAEL